MQLGCKTAPELGLRSAFAGVRATESARLSVCPISLLPDGHPRAPAEVPKPDLKQVGWTKAAELAKVARRDGQRFDCATWLHKARKLPKEEFKREVDRHLTGQETEPWEIIYFKLYKSQLPVIEQALETAALMLGTDKSRGYCLEMICADFLAGANLQNGNSNTLLVSLCRLYEFLPPALRQEFLQGLGNVA